MHCDIEEMKCICFLVFLAIFGIAELNVAEGAGECGRSSPDSEAWKLAPCAMAAQDLNAQVSDSCCQQVRKIGQNPRCLCAVMLSNTAKSSGIKPEVAVTIPKRCNIDRPMGYKCGGIFYFYSIIYRLFIHFSSAFTRFTKFDSHFPSSFASLEIASYILQITLCLEHEGTSHVPGDVFE
ncbi:uncharacterized protein LOC111297568 [Durio zibethinus]|uniref:Uncharacterized protein LOC111297568 n=1 Tax=Durio zibethinus TaxID=66656 RepID=A0A6P5Z6J3_DURZI|nr:uncharacterized protein LOC111297568 [Durio zibethinus]